MSADTVSYADLLFIEKSSAISDNLGIFDVFMNEALWIGVYPGMSTEMLDYMIETIRTFCLGGGK